MSVRRALNTTGSKRPEADAQLRKPPCPKAQTLLLDQAEFHHLASYLLNLLIKLLQVLI